MEVFYPFVERSRNLLAELEYLNTDSFGFYEITTATFCSRDGTMYRGRSGNNLQVEEVRLS
jgi:hypothetical protein